MPSVGGNMCESGCGSFHFGSFTSNDGDDSASVMPNEPKVVVRLRASGNGGPFFSTSCGMRS